MIKARLLLSAVFCAVLLSACGSSPPVRFYTLEPMQGARSSADVASTIGVGPLRFPDYLNRPQIVSSGENGKVVVAEFDRWADAAASTFQRALTANLNSLLDDTMAIEFPFGGGLLHPDYRLVAQVNQFSTDITGLATLDISWVMVTADDAEFISSRRSVFTAPAASDSSYASRVAAMNETLRAYSRQVAQLFQAAADQ
jgi:uncharacterized lipoprotein YmbA